MLKSLYSSSIYKRTILAQSRDAKIKTVVEGIEKKYGKDGINRLLKCATEIKEKRSAVHTAGSAKRHRVPASTTVRV